MTPGDLDILARTIYGEARNQPYQGQKAVAHVILNRVKKYPKDNTIAKACLRHAQFSAWNAGDPNLIKMQLVSTVDKAFREAMRAALESYDEDDFTKGATHYHTKSVSPPWSKGKTPCLVIQDHLFFNNID